MKKAYRICHFAAWAGFFLVTALWLFFGRTDPIPLGFALLPFTLLAMIAALLNRLLPKEERTKIELGFRCAIYHPYLDALLFFTLNTWYLLPLHHLSILLYSLIGLYALSWLILLICTLYQRYFN